MFFSVEEKNEAKRLLMSMVFHSYAFQEYVNIEIKPTKRIQYGIRERVYNELMSETCTISTGASRMVIIPNYASFVIKCDHPDYSEWDRYVQDRDNTSPFCEKESWVYEEAVRYGVSQYFAKEEFLCRIGNKDFYIQERVACDEDEVTRSAMDCHGVSSRHDSYYYSMDSFERIEPLFEECYGFDETCALNSFLDDNSINDVHEANVGFRSNGDIVIIDYCGYQSQISISFLSYAGNQSNLIFRYFYVII